VISRTGSFTYVRSHSFLSFDRYALTQFRTPLMWAAEYGHDEVVALLIERGANVNANDNSKMKAIHFAARYGRTEAARVMLDHMPSIARAKASVRHQLPLQYSSDV
jgi:ankyrin repeat protein